MSYIQELTSLSLSEASARLRSGQLTSLSLTQACLEKIEKLNPILNAFITVTADAALREAQSADKAIAEGRYSGPLQGIPIALKDLIDTAGVRTTAASAVYKDRVPAEDATVTGKLRQAGAVLLGKLNLHEFAYGGSGVVSHFGPVRNPWDTERTTGGSSSGSAAAVAAGMCFAALGTDTAGSIRLPAALCGITGLKPTYGLVSSTGVVPLCWTYDHVGPMTRNALDAAIVLDAIAGYDELDPTSIDSPYKPVAASIGGLKQDLRVGIPRSFFLDDLDSEVRIGFEASLELLLRVTWGKRKDVEIPLEASNVVRVAEPSAYHEHLLKKCAELYQPATLERIKAGAGISATKYLEVRRELEVLRRKSVHCFDEVDVIATPTVPCLAPKIGDLLSNPAELRPKELRMLRNTRPFNTLGWPTITVPCGSAGKLPIGLQIAAAPRKDALLLQVANALEKVTGWNQRLPVEPS